MTADRSKTVVACCSFCLKPNTEVAKLIAGPGVYICNECVDLCDLIIQEQTLLADQRRGDQARGDQPPPQSSWQQEVPLEDVMTTLPRVAAGSRQVEEHLTHWVRKARSLGATWAAIGAALDMTRQSAWERFSGEE
jgi:hypothetical protein